MRNENLIRASSVALVILIGWLVERLIFSAVERVTIRRWGMQR